LKIYVFQKWTTCANPIEKWLSKLVDSSSKISVMKMLAHQKQNIFMAQEIMLNFRYYVCGVKMGNGFEDYERYEHSWLKSLRIKFFKDRISLHLFLRILFYSVFSWVFIWDIKTMCLKFPQVKIRLHKIF